LRIGTLTASVLAALFLCSAARGAACVVLGRDPALLALAERHHWKRYGLIDGALRPLSEITVEGRTIDDVLVGVESVPVLPNIVQFPLAASGG